MCTCSANSITEQNVMRLGGILCTMDSFELFLTRIKTNGIQVAEKLVFLPLHSSPSPFPLATAAMNCLGLTLCWTGV